VVDAWRLLDTGLASAARNIALNRALLEARDADEIPSTLRFLRYAPSVLIGCRQSVAQEVELAECQAQAIVVQRRVTGGNAWLVNERALGWELYLHRREVGKAGLASVTARIGNAAAAAVAALGLDARYRAPGEVEVDCRAVGEIACAVEGEALLLQGVLVIAAGSVELARVLRIPGGRGTDAIAAAQARFAGIGDLLGLRTDVRRLKRNLGEAFESEFDVELREGDLTLTEDARYTSALREVQTADWLDLVASSVTDMPLLEGSVRGGHLRASLKYERPSRIVRQIWFASETVIAPRVLGELEAALRDCPLERVAARVERFFSGGARATPGATPQDFVNVVKLAIGEPLAA